jgi:hypothetical protein
MNGKCVKNSQLLHLNCYASIKLCTCVSEYNYLWILQSSNWKCDKQTACAISNFQVLCRIFLYIYKNRGDEIIFRICSYTSIERNFSLVVRGWKIERSYISLRLVQVELFSRFIKKKVFFFILDLRQRKKSEERAPKSLMVVRKVEATIFENLKEGKKILSKWKKCNLRQMNV